MTSKSHTDLEQPGISLREYVDGRFKSQEEAVNAAFSASEKAIIKAEILTDKRFDTVNEAVAQVVIQTSTLLPRAEYEANHQALNDKILVVTDTMNKSSGDKNLFVTNSELDTKLTLVVTKMEVTMKPIVDYVNLQKGKDKSSQITIGRIFAMIAATGTIVGIIISLTIMLTR